LTSILLRHPARYDYILQLPGLAFISKFTFLLIFDVTANCIFK